MQFLTPTELAERWDVTPAILSRLEARGLLRPDVTGGGLSGYAVPTVEAYEASGLHIRTITECVLAESMAHGREGAAKLLGVDQAELARFVEDAANNTESAPTSG